MTSVRNQRHHPALWSAIVVFLLAILSACGMSNTVKQPAENALQGITTTTQALKAAQAEADKLLAQPSTSFIPPDQRASAIGDGFTKAQKALDEANATASNQLKPLLEKDDDASSAAVTTATGEVNTKLSAADAAMKLPKQRIDGIVKLHADPEAALASATSSIAIIDRHGSDISAAETKALAAHPDKATSIKQHAQTVTVPRGQADAAFTTLKSELAKPKPDFVTVYNSAQVIRTTEPIVTKAATALLPQFPRLDHSEVITLVDMKMSCTINVSRTSWDENSDWDTDKNYSYPAIVLNGSGPQDATLCAYWMGVADQFEANGNTDQQIAHYSTGGWGSDAKLDVEDGIDRAMWDNLRLDPKKDWPGGDSASFALEDIVDVHYFHKYDTTVDGVTTHGDWIEVSAEVFDDHEYDLAMDISERRVGEFDDESNDEAAPAGMAYVGDPQYGTWQSDNNGSFWVWYGQYRYWGDFWGNNRIYQTDWNDYDRRYRGKTGYYGTTGGKDRWGTLSPSAGNYRSTWVSSGGQRASIRDAGPSGRAGGPGGGGK